MLLDEMFAITIDKTETWAERSCSWLKKLKGGVQELQYAVLFFSWWNNGLETITY